MQLKADLLLVLATILWSVSYLLTKIGLRELEPFTLNAIRFLLAFIIAFVIFLPKMKKITKDTFVYSIWLGIILVFVYFGATYGVIYTSLSNAGFLCSLAVIITPILAFFVKKQKLQPKMIFVVIMSFIGIAMLTLNSDFKPALGDILCIFCSFSYSIHLLVIETAVRKKEVDALQLGVLQLGTAGLFQLILAFVLEKPAVPTTNEVWFSVLFLSIFCTGIVFIIQTIAQKHTKATHVGVIFTLEPVFAGFIAFIFAGEVLTKQAYIGAVILILSLFIMEINLPALLKKKTAV